MRDDTDERAVPVHGQFRPFHSGGGHPQSGWRRQFRAHSAGSQPAGTVNPWAIHTLKMLDYPAEGYRSKSWSEFADGPKMDLIFTVCDSAAAESCPVWPGRPTSAHWGIPDPAAVEGSDAEKAAAFLDAFRMLKRRIDLLLALPIASLEEVALRDKLQAIGREADQA